MAVRCSMNTASSARKNARLKSLPSLTAHERAQLDRLLNENCPARIWEPLPGPQTRALWTSADELFFGGAAGGGKSFLLLGLALTQHRKSLILRRESVQVVELVEQIRRLAGAEGSWRGNGAHGGTLRYQGRVIELSGCEHEADKDKYQGRAHDLKAFDELPAFTRSQYQFIIGWNRTDDPQQRCRVVAAGNPPTTPEGRWIIEEWAPWLDKAYGKPAAAGELRWYAVVGGKLNWVDGPEPLWHKGERITPKSRTFIPACVTDNPIYMETGYMSRLQALPEPLRSQMLYGDFSVGTQDDPWQVIPTAWIRSAMERWQPRSSPGPLSALGVDVARGGDDETVLSRRYGTWFAPLERHAGSSTPDGPKVAALVIEALRGAKDPACVNIDVIGVGSSVYDHCRGQVQNLFAVNFAEASEATDKPGQLRFANLRAAAYWKLREALDPATSEEEQLALPPDGTLLADLAAPHWEYTSRGAKLEAKEEIKRRIGRSPDAGDAVVLAFLPTLPLVIGLPPVGKGSVVEQMPKGVFGGGSGQRNPLAIGGRRGMRNPYGGW